MAAAVRPTWQPAQVYNAVLLLSVNTIVLMKPSFRSLMLLVAVLYPMCSQNRTHATTIAIEAVDWQLQLDGIARYVKDGDLHQAEQQLQSLLDATPTTQPLKRADVLYRLQFVLRRLQQPDKAIRYAAACLALRETYLPAGHPLITDAIRAEAELQMDRRQYTQAEHGLNRALEVLETQGQRDTLSIADTLQSLGMLHLAQQQGEQAALTLGRALVIRQKIQAPNHPDILYNQARLAMALRQQKAYDSAIPILADVLLGEQANGNADSLHAAIVLRELAYCYHYLRDFDRAEDYYKQALSLFALNLGTHHHAYSVTQQALGWLYISSKREASGQALLRKANSHAPETANHLPVR